MSDNENAVNEEETSTKETWIIKEDLPSVTTPINGVLIDGTINPLTGNNTYGEPIKAGILSIGKIIGFNYGPHIPGSMIYGVYYGPIPGGDVSEKIWYYMTADGTRYTASDTTKLRTIVFDTAPTGDLLTWLESNAVKRIEGDLSIGDKKKAVNLQDLVYIRQYIDKQMKSETDKLNDYYTKEEIQEEYYTKAEIQEEYYDKTSSEETFYKKTDTVANATNAENATNASNDEEGNSIKETYQKKNEAVDKASMLDINLSGNNNAYNIIDISETGKKDGFDFESGLYHVMVVAGNQTWKFKDVVNTNVTENKTFMCDFFPSTNTTEKYNRITVTTDGRLVYGQSDGTYISVYYADNSSDHWKNYNIDNSKYKVVTFTVPPTGDLLDYLEENATIYYGISLINGDEKTKVYFSGLITVPKYGGFEISFNKLELNESSKFYTRNCFLIYEKGGGTTAGSIKLQDVDFKYLTEHIILLRKISD